MFIEHTFNAAAAHKKCTRVSIEGRLALELIAGEVTEQ